MTVCPHEADVMYRILVALPEEVSAKDMLPPDDLAFQGTLLRKRDGGPYLVRLDVEDAPREVDPGQVSAASSRSMEFTG